MKPQRPGEVVRVFYMGVGDAMREAGIQEAAEQRAADIARNANALARGVGIDGTFTVETSVRKRGKGKGRPEARVRADSSHNHEREHLLSLLQAAGRVV
ncbi:hypothetical protein Q8791_23465 [Nocardiopsis sp. CT-R113]|uniref:Uncharacterized protein n=1 Tax=Nocardiopsis codii TaxID=3065942 RepID=A0ABU7KD69_9ACTN|nr:hypothetical protein [Nocardiopsis sp. CT-R113]MEE2040180.1 hypothetical protein [Nocardiopsis sp. CT-R113]